MSLWAPGQCPTSNKKKKDTNVSSFWCTSIQANARYELMLCMCMSFGRLAVEISTKWLPEAGGKPICSVGWERPCSYPPFVPYGLQRTVCCTVPCKEAQDPFTKELLKAVLRQHVICSVNEDRSQFMEVTGFIQVLINMNGVFIFRLICLNSSKGVCIHQDVGVLPVSLFILYSHERWRF